MVRGLRLHRYGAGQGLQSLRYYRHLRARAFPLEAVSRLFVALLKSMKTAMKTEKQRALWLNNHYRGASLNE